MFLDPLLQSAPVIQTHTFAALAAAVLAPWQLLARKGTPRHRVVGYVWVLLMMAVALSSFWIHTIRTVGPWSLIHLLALYTVVMLPVAVLRAHRGNVEAHRRVMLGFVFGALLIAGAFTLWPGRLMHDVVFGV